jgi:hypothetical protein
VVFALIVTGLEKVACCQPEEDSPAKVTVASFVPDAVHRLPTWVPVLVLAL